MSSSPNGFIGNQPSMVNDSEEMSSNQALLQKFNNNGPAAIKINCRHRRKNWYQQRRRQKRKKQQKQLSSFYKKHQKTIDHLAVAIGISALSLLMLAKLCYLVVSSSTIWTPRIERYFSFLEGKIVEGHIYHTYDHTTALFYEYHILIPLLMALYIFLSILPLTFVVLFIALKYDAKLGSAIEKQITTIGFCLIVMYLIGLVIDLFLCHRLSLVNNSLPEAVSTLFNSSTIYATEHNATNLLDCSITGDSHKPSCQSVLKNPPMSEVAINRLFYTDIYVFGGAFILYGLYSCYDQSWNDAIRPLLQRVYRRRQHKNRLSAI